MRYLLPLFLLLSAYAVTLDYGSYTTAPSPLDSQGYLYITFCSKSSATHTFYFYPAGFSVSPSSVKVDFSGSSTSPDCRQVVLFASSDSPGMYNLIVKQGSDEWTLPVQFEKSEPLNVYLSKSALHTGYDSATLSISGEGQDVWVTVGASVVGLNKIYRPDLPAAIPLVFHFSSAGFYSVPVTIQYTVNNLTVVKNYTLGVRVEEAPVRVSGNLVVPSDGYANLTFNLSLPETIYSGVVSLSSKCLEGGTSTVVENFLSGPVSFRVRGTCDPGLYSLTISAGDFQVSVPLTISGPEGFETFTNTFVKDGKHTLEVTIANEGSQTMKAVSVRLEPGDYETLKEGAFLGDLEFGDFDSAELVFIPRAKRTLIRYTISYTLGGEKFTVEREYTYTARGGSSRWWLYGLIALAAGGYYVKRRKARG